MLLFALMCKSKGRENCLSSAWIKAVASKCTSGHLILHLRAPILKENVLHIVCLTVAVKIILLKSWPLKASLLNYLFIYLFIYFMAVLGLRFCARAFSICGKWGPLFIAVRGPLSITAPLVAEHTLQTRRLSSCGSRAQPLRGMWDLPRPGLEPMSPASAGRLSTTAPPGKPLWYLLLMLSKLI